MRGLGWSWLLLAVVLLGCGDEQDSDSGWSPGAAATAPGDEAGAKPPAVYTYTTKAGTPGFADSLGQVPREYRARARIKVIAEKSFDAELAAAMAKNARDGIALNSELARAFRQQVDAQHSALATSEGCSYARSVDAEADTPLGTAKWVWREHSTWVVAGCLALVLLITAPFIARRVGGARWARTVFVAIGALAFVGTMAHVGKRATSALQGARRVASLCDDTSSDPVVRAGAVSQLRVELEQMTASRTRALDSL